MTRPIAAVVVFGLLSLACGAAPPVWYESEPGKTRWTVPLVDPLGDAELLVPVFVHDRGPYLFSINPDAPTTVIDRGIAESLDLYPKDYVRVLNQRDKTAPRRVFEILSLSAGELRARKLDVIGAPAGTLRAAGRSIDGVIGADLLSRTIVVDIDRDAGVVRLALTGHEQVPQGAARVPAALHVGVLRVSASVGNQRDLNLIVHLARRTTALRREILSAVGVELESAQEPLVDYTGDRVVVSGRGRLEGLAIGAGFELAPLAVIPYEDERGRRDIDYHGFLGQNALSRYRVIVDRDDQELWLAPRSSGLQEGAAVRLARWGDAFTRCAALGCATPRFDEATRVLALVRDPAAPPGFSVVVQALDADGAAIDAPLLRARFDDGRGEVVLHEPGTVAEYAGAARFAIVDAGPL